MNLLGISGVFEASGLRWLPLVDLTAVAAKLFVATGKAPFNLDLSVLSNFHTEEEKESFRKMVKGWGQTISEISLPSRSSYFGIIDLAGFPKDRYWLYQSRWRPDLPIAHILPHWTWPGREGEITPVHVYTSGDEAELFVNGKSMGRKAREGYRIVWDEVVYQPGKIEVVAYKDGQEWARDSQQTAGRPAKAAASIDYAGEDLIYVSVDIQDRNGILVPDADNVVDFSLKGPVGILVTDSGDPTSHIPFYSHSIPAFHGRTSVVVRRTGPGSITVSAISGGLRKTRVVIP